MTWIAALLPFLTHETGHYIAGLLCGVRLRFYRRGWRYLWRFPPGLSLGQRRFIAQAGFGSEFLGLIPAFPVGAWGYLVVAILHFWAYPWYARGRANDFEWMGRR